MLKKRIHNDLTNKIQKDKALYKFSDILVSNLIPLVDGITNRACENKKQILWFQIIAVKNAFLDLTLRGIFLKKKQSCENVSVCFFYYSPSQKKAILNIYEHFLNKGIKVHLFTSIINTNNIKEYVEQKNQSNIDNFLRLSDIVPIIKSQLTYILMLRYLIKILIEYRYEGYQFRYDEIKKYLILNLYAIRYKHAVKNFAELIKPRIVIQANDTCYRGLLLLQNAGSKSIVVQHGAINNPFQYMTQSDYFFLLGKKRL